MTTEQWIAIASVAATVIIGVVSWIVSAANTRRSLKRRCLSYRMKMEPLLSPNLPDDRGLLKVQVDGKDLPEPVFLSVDIINSGNEAIEDPPITIDTFDTTYIIPAFIEDPPPGYDDLWTLKRPSTQSCSVTLKHINRRQVVKARFFLDSVPSQPPVLKCPMPNVEVRRVEVNEISPVLRFLLNVIEPKLLTRLDMLR